VIITHMALAYTNKYYMHSQQITHNKSVKSKLPSQSIHWQHLLHDECHAELSRQMPACERFDGELHATPQAKQSTHTQMRLITTSKFRTDQILWLQYASAGAFL